MNKGKATSTGRVIGYIRCSSSDQVSDGETLQRQRELILAYGQSKSIDAIEIICDEGISGFRSANRPGFQRLIELCKSGQVRTVIVYDLSRLSRSVRDTLAFVEDVVQQRGIALVSLQQDLDTSTPHGKAFLAFTAVFNELYRNEIAFRTKIALRHKKSKGERYSGSVPYGFDDDGSGNLVASEQDQDTIALVRSLNLDGMSLRAIGRELAARGIRTKTGKVAWNSKTVRDLLARGDTHRGSE